jgi:hypothetical protein
MTAKEWFGVMQKAADFPKGMERLIEKYGEMLLKEQMQVNKNCVLPDVNGSLPTKKYDIDFAGNVLAGIEISNNTPSIFGAINGYGDGIDIDKITITERQ